MKKTQKEIAMALIQVRNIIDFMDDGYHLKEVGELVKISNILFLHLSEANQKKFQEWDAKRFVEKAQA